MRSALIAVLLSLIPFGSIAQDSTLKADGRMWSTWGNSGSQNLFIKAAYVQGAVEGLRVGAVVGYYSGRLDEKSDSSPNELQAGADKTREKYAPQNTSVLDIVHQMDRFYSDYRNTPVCMIVAVQESISSLRGTSMSEQELEMVRKGCNP